MTTQAFKQDGENYLYLREFALIDRPDVSKSIGLIPLFARNVSHFVTYDTGMKLMSFMPW